MTLTQDELRLLSACITKAIIFSPQKIVDKMDVARMNTLRDKLLTAISEPSATNVEIVK